MQKRKHFFVPFKKNIHNKCFPRLMCDNKAVAVAMFVGSV